MDQRYKATVEGDSNGKKAVMTWQFAQMEGYVPPVEGMHPTIISPADPVTKALAQDYYIQLSSVTPVEGLPAIQTFISPADPGTKVRQDYYLQSSSVAPESLAFINSRSSKQEGLLNTSAHSSRDDDHVSNLSEDMSCTRVKLLSGYGGKILPRPSDGRLRYVGGETRMITVPRDVSFSNLMAKMTEVQPQTIAIKYQLPDEDLDALVSVSSDEDLENMMEEYDKLEAGDAHPRLRVFLFTSLDYDLPAMGDSLGNSEQQYLDAVNGLVEGGPRKQSESSTQDISSLAGYLQEAPIAVPLPQLSQGIPVMTRYVPSSSLPALANGAAISPFVTATSFHYAYVDRDSSKQNSFGQVTDVPADAPLLVKADMEPGNRLAEGQKYVIAASNVSTGESGYFGSQEAVSETDLLARKGEQLMHQMQQLQIAQAPAQEAHRMLPKQYQAFVEAPALQHDVGFSELQQKESILGPAFVHWPNEASKAPCSSTYAGVGVSLQAPDQAFYFYGNDSLHQGTADMSMWSSPFTSEMKDSDPSLGGQRMSQGQGLNTYLNTVKGSLLPDQAQTEPISSYEYEALGEKLSLKKPTEQVNAKVGFKEQMVQTVPPLSREDLVGLNLPQQGGDDGRDNAGWDGGPSRSDRLTQGSEIPRGYDQENGIDASDRSLFYFNAIGSGTNDLSGWSTESNAGSAANRLHSMSAQMSSPSLLQSRSFVEPEEMRSTKSAGSQLSDSLVNFLEDSLHATSAGVSDSCTIQMPHTGSSSNNMVLDLLTSDDAFCKTSLTSTGSTFASSASKSSSYANTPLVSEASSVTKFLHENLNAGLIFSVDDDNVEKPHSWVQMPSQVASKENLEKEVAPLFTQSESFAFTNNDTVNETESAEEKFERCCMSPDTSDHHSAKPREDILAENVLTAGYDATLADLPDITYEPEGDNSSAAESEAEVIARARGLQIIKDGDLEEIRELGSGTFGTVYHGKWRGTDVAVKRIKATCFYGSPSEQVRLKDDFWGEAGILARLHHPNVVAFYGIVPDSPGGTLATVTEFMVNGSLKQVLQRKDRNIDRRRRLLIAMDAAFGMEYLHDKKIIHFDLKGENLLVNMRDPHRPVCKVGDLGLSKIKHKTMVSGGVRGTLPWMAPELLNGKSILVTEKVDVFSFGIVMWELLTGEEPYADLHYGVIIGGIVSNTLRPPIPSSCEPEWRSLMERCWADDPSDRPTFSEIVKELRAMCLSLLSKQGQAPGQQAAGAQALTV